MMAISMARAKALCSGTELALVKASSRQEIGSHTAARLKQKQARARKLRDKWRDQLALQKRKAKGTAGGSADNRNSAEKAALFDEVLSRFAAQLEKKEAAGMTPGPMGRRRSTKTARSRTHRAARAEVRSELAEAKRVLKSKSKKKAAVQAVAADAVKKSKSAVAAATKAAAPEPVAIAAAAPKHKAKRPRPTTSIHATALEAGRKAQGLRVTKKSQLQARTAAKQDRLKAGGLVRIQKSRSAANKRNQGRRDSR